MNLQQRYAEALEDRKSGNLFRMLPEDEITGIDFTNNDYLCLTRHPVVIESVLKSVDDWGTGGKASRLLGAEAQLARDLESRIADAKSVGGRALVFTSGFQLNHSVVKTLLNEKILGHPPQVFADKLIHASLHSGIDAAGVRQIRFRHNDLDHLESLLVEKGNPRSPKFVFVESIYSMDGDLADLQRLYALKAKFQFFLYVDDAHAIGVTGNDGVGLATHGENQADLVVGTFSKSLASSGGFVVASKSAIDLIVNFAAGFIYSTTPAPPTLAAAKAALNLLPELTKERDHLNRLAGILRSELRNHSIEVGNSRSQIVPVMIGDSARAMHVTQQLADRNLHVSCIRPPTVPPNSARLRVSLNSGHTEQDVRKLCESLIQLGV